MPQKSVSLQVLIRDEFGEVISCDNAIGTTEDDGVTVTIPLGYLPNLSSVPAQDVLRTLVPPPVDLPAPESVSRTDDTEASTSTLVFG